MPEKSGEFWALIISLAGWIVTFVSGGIWVGKHQQKLTSHDEFLKKISSMLDENRLITRDDLSSIVTQLKEVQKLCAENTDTAIKKLEHQVEKLSEDIIKVQVKQGEQVSKLDDLKERFKSRRNSDYTKDKGIGL